MSDSNNLPDIHSEDLAISTFCDALTDGGTAAGALAIAVERFPGHASLLADYAMQHEFIGEIPEPSPAELAKIEARAKALIASTQLGSSIRPITSLLSRLKALSIEQDEVVAKLSISVSILGKLERRLIDAATIPSAFLSALAAELRTSSEAVRHYLALSETLSPQAKFRADTPPGVQSELDRKRESFTHALATSVESGEISEQLKNRWTDTLAAGQKEP